MKTIGWDAIRVTLHVLTATVWVGGQFILAAPVPVLRRVAALAVSGALSAFTAVCAVFLGVLLAG